MTGDLDLAIRTQRQAIAQARADGAYDLAGLKATLTGYLLENGDLVEATATTWGRLTATLSDALVPTDSPGASLITQSEELMAVGRYGEAADLLGGCLAIRQKALPEGHWLVADTTSRLGHALAGQGKFTEAEALLLEGYAGLNADELTPGDGIRQAIERIINLYESWEKPDQVSRWRQQLDATTAESATDGPNP
jgi:hypothetical protein